MRRTSRKTESVLSLRALSARLRAARRKGCSVAFTNGCFDLLHAGHLRLLEEVKARADLLVVGVNSDASVRRLKGPGRPVVPARERARLVAGLKPVDYVVIFQEDTPERVIRALRPDLLAKGADWKRGQIVGQRWVRQRGGQVVRIRLLKGRSTTELIRRLKRERKRGWTG